MLSRAIGLTLAAICAAPLAGCDARNDADYRGEVVTTLSGTVTNEAGLSVRSPDVTLVWISPAKAPDSFEATRVPVQGGFPASFSLEMYGPPSDDIIASLGINDGSPPEPRVGVALILVLPSDYKFGSSESPPTGAWGLADVVLVYAEGDLPPGSRAEAHFSGPLTKGYHLMRVVPRDEAWGVDECLAAVKAVNPAVSERAVRDRCAEQFFDLLVESPQGLATPVNVRIATDHEMPNLT